MGTKTYITNNLNAVVAQVEETDDEIILYSVMGAMLGRYSKSNNMTTYPNGALIGYGNSLGMLIPASP